MIDGRHAPITRLEQSVDRALKGAPVDVRTYAGEGAIVLRTLRRWYGDEVAAVLRAALEQEARK